MILSVLAGVVTYSFVAGRCGMAAAAMLSLGIALLCLHRHEHGILAIDVLVRRSRFFSWNSTWKVACSCLLLILCILAPSPVAPLLLSVVLPVLTAVVGGCGIHRYWTLVRLPLGFLLVSSLTLLWDFTDASSGAMWAIHCFGGWLVVTREAQETAWAVVARALGAIQCLYFLNLSTPMPEILHVLRKLRVPDVILDLAALIYHYIFVLLSVYQEMQSAACSRLGYRNLRRSLQTTGIIYGNLIGKSFRRTEASFDAMTSRCYLGRIRFLHQEKPATACQVLTLGGIMSVVLVLVVLEYT